jgi:hypothetical protein
MRHEDWPERLNDLLIECSNKPFVWGHHDCCLFAAHAVRELTGDDHTGPFMGRYRSARTAAKLLAEHGGVRGIAGAALGEEIPPLTAGRGDVVLLHTEEHGDTLAVCIGERCAVPGMDRLLYVPLTEAVTAWRVC